MLDFHRCKMSLRKLLFAIVIANLAGMITARAADQNSLQGGLLLPYPAPPIAGITDWINSPPLDFDKLKGKVVLVDFWTYSCINCIRTLPYLLAWYKNYHDKGFEIIGVHAPEFDFEKDLKNVKNAVVKDGIHYPVALDNNFVTWQNFKNSYWPAHYLIDQNGMVVYQHFGEGDYDVTENNIRFLLGMGKVTMSTSGGPVSSFSQTPETYLGYARAENNASPEIVIKGRPAHYSFPNSLSPNEWAMQGFWLVGAEYIVAAQDHAALKIHFNAGKVYIVMGTVNDKPIAVKVLLNGAPIASEKGKDVVNGIIKVERHKLYEAVVLKSPGEGDLELISSDPGLEVYTFTFGG